MSIIFGIQSHGAQPDEAEFQGLHRALSDGWPPDSVGFWQKKGCRLGQLMLYNTPESLDEMLPLEDKETGCVILADARIDNRPELADRLGLSLSGMPDSRLILACYHKWKEDCVRYLIGDFAFAIRDMHNRTLFCARDHLGVKPFYYALHDGCFYFSSLVKGLSSLDRFSRVNPSFHPENLIIPPPRWDGHTFFEAIKKLPPAHSLTVSAHGLKLMHYWWPEKKGAVRYKRDNEYLDAFQSALQRAVSDRLRSYRPIGVQVSGGLDSSGVLAYAGDVARKRNLPVYAYTHGISDQHRSCYIHLQDDFELARDVSRYVGVDRHTKVSAENDSYLDLIDIMLRLNGGPVHKGSMTIPTFVMGRVAREDSVVTVMSGFPGDECVTFQCGMPVELMYQDRDFSDMAAYLCRHPVSGGTWAVRRLIDKAFPVKKKKTARDSGGIFSLPERVQETWNHPEHSVAGQSRFSDKRYDRWDRLLHSPVSQRFETEYAAAAALGLEMRYPLADIRLIHLFQSFPARLKRNRDMGRLLFRKAIRGKVPDKVVWMQKSTVSAVPGMALIKTRDAAPVLSYLEQKKPSDIPDGLNLEKMKSRFELFKTCKAGPGRERSYNGYLDLAMQLLRYEERKDVL